MEITKDTMIGDLLREDFGCAAILMGAGMHCVGCPASQMETIEEACAVHGLDPDGVLNEINAYLASRETV